MSVRTVILSSNTALLGGGPIILRVESNFRSQTYLTNIFSRSNRDTESLPGCNRQTNNSVYHMENTQVTFNPKNFKILYVINSENCFYRKLALTRAKHVSRNF